jgi:hypothetical protein
MGKEIACRVLVSKPEGKRSLGRPRSRRKENIKISLLKICFFEWIHLA